jgi:hypothetical protein
MLAWSRGKGGTAMRLRLLLAGLGGAGVMVAGGVAPAFAHEGGHQGGCEDFGHVNAALARDPAAFGFPEARNLGDIVTAFAQDPNGRGIADVVETFDHVLFCGEG